GADLLRDGAEMAAYGHRGEAELLRNLAGVEPAADELHDERLSFCERDARAVDRRTLPAVCPQLADERGDAGACDRCASVEYGFDRTGEAAHGRAPREIPARSR